MTYMATFHEISLLYKRNNHVCLYHIIVNITCSQSCVSCDVEHIFKQCYQTMYTNKYWLLFITNVHIHVV